MTRAHCAGHNPELFFPITDDVSADAVRICRDCPVRVDCLRWAIRNDEHGVWGGSSRAQRLRLVEQAPRQQRIHLAGGQTLRERADDLWQAGLDVDQVAVILGVTPRATRRLLGTVPA
jgi:WhiB family redox-sensing transcriptional regulator